MARRAPAPFDLALLAVGVLAFGAAAVVVGQSTNWDLRNYHWYDGWAWLHGHHRHDIAAAQAQTWFNPILPALLYALLSSLKPAVGTFVLGTLQGLNLLPLHRIAHELLPGRRKLALLVTFVGACGATQRGELGATFGDNLVSLPLLIALALLVCAAPSARRSLVAGALLGLAVGLKLTALPVAAGIALAAFWFYWRCAELRRCGSLLVVGGAVAFLAIDGAWMWQLWRDFGNPLFPLFGSTFGGEFAVPVELRDTRWLPRNAVQWLAYPLFWLDQPRRVSELWFLDLRVPLAFIAAIALPLWLRRAQAASAQPRRLNAVLLAAAAIYLFWLVLFGYYRYLVVLEMLAPLVVAVALLTLPRRVGVVTACCVLVVAGLATRAPRWGRLERYGDSYAATTLPPSAQQSGALVVFGDNEPFAFLAPSFPAGTRFVRIRGNVMGPPIPEWGLDRLVRARIAAHRGPLLLVVAAPAAPALAEALQRHALQLDAASCTPIDSRLIGPRESRPLLCEMEKADKQQ